MSEQLRATLVAWLGTEEASIRYETAMNRIGPTDIAKLHAMDGNATNFMMMAGAESCCVSNIPYMAYIENGVGVIEVNGVLTAEFAPWNRYMGLVSYDEIAYAARAMAVMADGGEVSAVILKVNSPGGDANGIETASSALKLLAKVVPVYTYTDKEMCSAGYWLGCIGLEIWSSKLATVGSIGVMLTIRTVVDALKMQGMKVRVMREGQYKAALNPFEEPKEEDLARIQAQMHIMYEMFTAHVADQLGMKAAELKSGPGQGQTFLGIQAIKEGLVHKIGSMEDMVKALRTKYSPGNTGGSPSKTKAISGSNPMKLFKIGNKTYQLNETGIAAVSAGLTEDEAAADHANLQEVQEKTADEIAADEAAATEAARVAAEAEEAARIAADAEAAAAAARAAGANPQLGAGDVSAILQLSAANAAVSGELAVAKAKLSELEAKVTLAETNNASLRGIAIKAINKMEVALRSAPSKSTEFDSDSAVVAKFGRVEADFNTQFKPGAKANHSTDEHSSTAGATGVRGGKAVAQAAKTLTELG